MNKLIITVLIAALSLITSCKNTPKKIKQPAKLQLTINKLMTDTMRVGNVYTHYAHFSNVGEQTLVIDSVNSTCDCLIGKLKQKTILTGQSDSIKLELHPKSAGVYERSIIIKSNDPETFSIMDIEGYVLEENLN